MQNASLDKRITIRLTNFERQKIQADAEKLGLSVSEMLRFLCSFQVEIFTEETAKKYGKNGIKVLLIDASEIKQLKRQIRAWGHHYNQAVHALNIIQSKRFLSQEETRKYLNSAMDKLAGIETMKTGLETFVEGLDNEARGKVLGRKER